MSDILAAVSETTRGLQKAGVMIMLKLTVTEARFLLEVLRELKEQGMCDFEEEHDQAIEIVEKLLEYSNE